MKRRVLYLFGSCCCALTLLVNPLLAIAEGLDVPEPVIYTSSVIITELQTGTQDAASEEFIELYNVSDEPVDITGWQVRYVNANGSPDDTKLLVEIAPGTDNQPMILPAHAYFVMRTDNMIVSPTVLLKQTFTAGLAKTDKTVGLFAVNDETCRREVVDAVAWRATPSAMTFGEGRPLHSSAVNAKEKVFQRYRSSSGLYVDKTDNAHDFVLSAASATLSTTPGGNNMQLLPETLPPPEPALSLLETIDIEGCELPIEEPPFPDPPRNSPPVIIEKPVNDEEPKPSIPARNAGLSSPQLSELLPNPGSPKTDADDEFIELYNPNDKPFELTGYKLETGTTTKRRYTFPVGTLLAPKTFVAFFSAETNLGLSNSGTTVRLLDPTGRILVESVAYTSAKDDQSWIFAEDKWQWTTRPTPSAVNVLSAPLPAKAKKKSGNTETKNAAATKGANTSGTDSTDSDTAAAASVTPSASLHGGVLALVAASAILYGAYEYRHDVANKIRKFRQNRTARRDNRPSA